MGECGKERKRMRKEKREGTGRRHPWFLLRHPGYEMLDNTLPNVIACVKIETEILGVSILEGSNFGFPIVSCMGLTTVQR